MNHVAVSSSNIESVAYDGAGRLQIKMKHGKMYDYQNVPSEVYSGLMGARSMGSYLHENIKGKCKHAEVAQ